MTGANSENRVSRLIKLNRDIHNTSTQIEKIQQNKKLLRNLAEEFSMLVFDKLALDAVYQRDFNSDVDLQALRVIIGRTKVAMQYFDNHNAPVSELSKAKKSTFKGKKNDVSLESKFSMYFSSRSAEKRLCKLTDQLVELQRQCNGLTKTIRRFEEDNKALKTDITALRESPGVNYDANFGQHTWTRLAGVDFMTNSEKRQSICSQRRMSSLSMRRMSVTSTKSNNWAPEVNNENTMHPIGLYNTQPSKSCINLSHPNVFNSYPQYPMRRSSMHTNMDHKLSGMASRRRSGALSDSDLSRNDSMASTNTSFSTHSYTKHVYPSPVQPVTSAHLGQWRRPGNIPTVPTM